MEIEKALQYFKNLVNSAIASGAYKTIEQVQEAKQAIDTIESHLKNNNNGEGKEDSKR